MTFIRKRKLEGKVRYYLEQTIRLPDGKVKKISKLLPESEAKQKNIAEKYSQYFLDKEKELSAKFAIKKYRKDAILTEKLISELEEMKVEYKHILKKLTENQLKDMFDRFVCNFTYETNAIEGNSLTLKDVTIIIYEKEVIKGKSLREIYETRNSRNVMDLILSNKFDITKEDILKLHKLVIADTGVSIGFKKLPNFLLMRNVQTTPPEKVEAEIDELIKWYNSAKESLHPLLLAAAFHARFEKIHPFEDGNGRVGRFLANIILINAGYPPLIIRKTARASYFSALSAFDNGYEDKLKRFFIEKYEQSFNNFFKVYVKYLK